MHLLIHPPSSYFARTAIWFDLVYIVECCETLNKIFARSNRINRTGVVLSSLYSGHTDS